MTDLNHVAFFEKMMNPYSYFCKIFNMHAESAGDIKDAFKLIKPYLDPDGNYDCGLFESYIIELKIILTNRYSIEEYPELWI